MSGFAGQEFYSIFPPHEHTFTVGVAGIVICSGCGKTPQQIEDRARQGWQVSNG